MSAGAPIPILACSTADLETIDYLEAYVHDTSLMHNTLIRGYNSIVAQALKIQPCEISAFAIYVAAFCETLRRHCEGENFIIFPQLAAHVTLDGSDNLAVLQKLERVEEWTPEKTDPAELKAAVELLGPAFASNMHDQVKQISPALLQPFISGPELRALVDNDIMWIGQNSHMEYLLPFLILHHDRKTNAFWPGLPADTKAAIPMLAETRPESWYYAPFDVAGNLRLRP